MKKQKQRHSLLTRLTSGLAAVFLMAVTASVLLAPQSALAGQISSRKIEVTSSTKAATGVSYKVTFTPQTTAAQSLIVQFCDSAIIGSTCTVPTGFTAASVGFTAGTGTTSWALGTAADAPTATTVKITKSTGSNLATSAVDFTLTNVTNPTNAGSYYARIYTYGNTTYNGYSSATSIGTTLDTGGFALSATDNVTINATVMETLTFCVNKAAPGNGCTSLSTPINIVLGHGSPVTLDASAVDTDTMYTQLSTNAVSGAAVSLKTGNTCTGLSRDAGSTCPIPGKGAFGTVSAGTAFFGLNVANGTGGTGTVTANGNYGTTGGSYGMGSNVTSTYGDPIESSSAAVANVNSLLTYGATAAATTPAGVYAATHTYIATGTF